MNHPLLPRRAMLALPASLCLSCCRQMPAGAQSKSIRVGTSFLPSTSPLFVALDQGYFAARGLHVEPEIAQTSNVLVPMLLSGRVDAALLAFSPALINGIAKGAPVRLVYARDFVNPECRAFGDIFYRLQSFPHGVRSFRDLAGKKIAYSYPGSVSEYALDLVVEAAGLARKDIQALPLKQSDAMAALRGGVIDAMVLTAHVDPATGALAGIGGILPGLALSNPSLQLSFAAFGERLLGPERNRGRDFLRALRQGTRDFLAGRQPANLPEMARRNGYETEALAKACRASVSASGILDHASIQRYLDWAFRKGYLDQPAAGISQIVDAAFLAEL